MASSGPVGDSGSGELGSIVLPISPFAVAEFVDQSSTCDMKDEIITGYSTIVVQENRTGN
jgi:hypothetical protein